MLMQLQITRAIVYSVTKSDMQALMEKRDVALVQVCDVLVM